MHLTILFPSKPWRPHRGSWAWLDCPSLKQPPHLLTSSCRSGAAGDKVLSSYTRLIFTMIPFSFSFVLLQCFVASMMRSFNVLLLQLSVNFNVALLQGFIAFLQCPVTAVLHYYTVASHQHNVKSMLCRFCIVLLHCFTASNSKIFNNTLVYFNVSRLQDHQASKPLSYDVAQRKFWVIS